LDISGVDIVDSFLGRVLAEIASTAALLPPVPDSGSVPSVCRHQHMTAVSPDPHVEYRRTRTA
ncbi:hypothetical protein ACWC2M_41330, partial [Streptomyces sp. NPDC001761]